uniref:Transposase (Putative), gypsy type n=1 Tax=Tanacetum cinerariifolium TaxID=118510 RepID=A0A6L2K0G4_TANCI|nr:transposase (putative), gypsy type [Tanacetum cinerariifolium]
MFLNPFLCLIGMSSNYNLDEDTYPTFLHDDETGMNLFAFIQVTDPTKVKVRERKHAKGEARLLDSTVGRVVSLLPISLSRAESELKTEIAMGVRIIADENVVIERPKRPRKKRQSVTDSSGSSHPPNWCRGCGDLAYGTSLVSTTPEYESGVLANSITGLNIRTIGASERFVISLDSSHHFSTNASGAEGDSIISSAVVPPVMTEAMVTFHAVNIPPDLKMVKENTTGPSYFAIVQCGYHSSSLSKCEVRMRTEYCLSERRRLESECEKQAGLLKAKDDKVENLKAQLLLKEAEAIEKIRAVEIDAMKQRNVALKNEKESLDGKVAELQSSIAAKDLEVEDLNIIVSSLRSQKDGLVDQVHALETTCFGLRNKISAKLDTDLLEMALHLEEKFYPHLLTTISGRRWLLTHGLKLTVVKCLNSQECLSALGAAISRAIEKGMQDGLSVDIDHGKASRSLADVVAYNPAVEADYNFSIQRLHENPLVDPLSIENLIGEADTSNGMPTTTATTTALSTTFASANSVPPITIEDYEIVGKRKPRKGQNRIKTGQKQEACRSREKFKAVTVERARKTEQNAKRMARNANTVKSHSSFKRKKKRKGLEVHLQESSTTRVISAYYLKLWCTGTMDANRLITIEG